MCLVVQNRSSIDGLRTRIFGRSRWNLLLGALAVVILIGSFSALAINTLNQKESEKFNINGKEYEWDTLYDDFDTVVVQEFEGVPLTILIEDAEVEEPSTHQYKIVGADGYFKTVTWRDMESGILTLEEKKVVFETKAKAYWVRDVVEIQVV
jgi:hypothetical protein